MNLGISQTTVKSPTLRSTQSCQRRQFAQVSALRLDISDIMTAYSLASEVWYGIVEFNVPLDTV